MVIGMFSWNTVGQIMEMSLLLPNHPVTWSFSGIEILGQISRIGLKMFSSVQFSSVAQSCPTLCDPMNRNTPGLPVHHQLPDFTQTHVHQVSDAIQPSHPLLSLSPPALNPSQHQSLFQWVNSSQCMTSQIYYSSSAGGASRMAQTVKNLPAKQETWGLSLGREDPPEKGMDTHSSILAWRIPWTEEYGQL